MGVGKWVSGSWMVGELLVEGDVSGEWEGGRR